MSETKQKIITLLNETKRDGIGYLINYLVENGVVVAAS